MCANCVRATTRVRARRQPAANQSKGGKQAQRSKRSDPPGSGGPRVETPPDPNFPGARSAHISTRRGQARVVATSWWYIFPDLHSFSTPPSRHCLKCCLEVAGGYERSLALTPVG